MSHAGSPQEWKDTMAKLGEAVKQDPNVYIEEFHVSGGSFKRTATVKGQVRKDSGEVAFGTEIKGHIADGRDATVCMLSYAFLWPLLTQNLCLNLHSETSPSSK